MIDPDILISDSTEGSISHSSHLTLQDEIRTPWSVPSRGPAQQTGAGDRGSSGLDSTSTTMLVHYPSLISSPGGSSLGLILPPDVVVKTERFSENGDRVDPFRNRLKDVLITLMDSSGLVLYHKW